MSLASAEKATESQWPSEISNRESKEKIAASLAENLQDGQVVGVGSGTTSYLTLLALQERAEANGFDFSIVATSVELARTAMALEVNVLQLGQVEVAWGFDGADEVCPEGRLIKGLGGAMFREKLQIASQAKTFIVADESKKVSKLGEKFPVPVEVVPQAIDLVRDQLGSLGATEAPTRAAGGKDGPVITEQGGVILDVRFDTVPHEAEIEAIPGVLACGVFERWPYELVMV